MADVETHTREELEGMSRLVLRRICKARGMSSEDCSKMEFDDMVNWIDENQGGGGGGSKKAAPKAASKASSKKAPPKGGGKAAPPKGKKAPPKAPPKGRAASEDTGEVAGDDLANLVLEQLSGISERLEQLEAKVDTLGEVVDTNIGSVVEDVGELRADTYKVLERQDHLHKWMRTDGILTDEAAPDGLDFDDKDAQIDAECSGNEEGGE